MRTTPTRRRFALDLQYSLSDRIRYYWNVPQVRAACEALVTDLRSRGMPLTLLSQYLPRPVRGDPRRPHRQRPARSCCWRAYARVLDGYARACGSVEHG